jgi:ComF family protein
MSLFRCFLCSSWCKISDFICQDCFKLLPWNNNCCNLCAAPLDSSIFSQKLCVNCVSNPFVVNINSIFLYSYPISSMLHDYKYGSRLDFADFFAKAILNSFDIVSLPDLIVPVPLHSNRLRWRGFNQSFEIAKIIGFHLGVKVSNRVCVRLKNTISQTTYDRSERWVNIDNAFHVVSNVSNKNIIIIDDVVTTGATVASLSSTLRNAGCGSIEVWCVARR